MQNTYLKELKEPSFYILVLLMLGLITLFLIPICNAQVNFLPNPYTQNFGTSTVASWTDNSTFPGWYVTTWKVTVAGSSTFNGTENITTGEPTNPGEWEVYQCNGGTDMKLGTRPSNGDGGPDSPGQDGRNGIGLGLCIKNNFAVTIKSIQVSFEWFQLSLAENGNESNQNFFSYFVSASNLTGADLPNNAHAYTNVAAGNYTAPNNSASCCSNQISGYPGTVNGTKTFCVAVNIPANNYIMLRWWDPNNANNDPHMAIDNVSVTAYSDAACATILPVELLNFNVQCYENVAEVKWTTATEINNDFFSVERSSDGINYDVLGTVSGAGNSSFPLNYFFTDYDRPNAMCYYRLKQTDFNGDSKYFNPVSANCQTKGFNFINAFSDLDNVTLSLTFTDEKQEIITCTLYNSLGEQVSAKTVDAEIGTNQTTININSLRSGIYFVQIKSINGVINKKIDLLRNSV